MLNGRLERFLVVDLRSALTDLDAELAAQTVDDDLQVQLAHAADHGLAAVLVGLDGERRVFFGQFAQSDTELVEILLSLRLDGQTDHRFGERHRFEYDRVLFVAKRVARADILEADGGADIAGADYFHRVLLVSVHLVNTADTLLLARTAVVHIRAGLELARINPDERQTAYERIRSDLESQTAERIALGRLARGLLARTGIGADHGVDVDRRGQESHHIIEQQLHALVLEGRAAEHRHDRHRDGRFADRGDQLVGSDRIGILEELLHQRIVGRRDFLDQLRAPFGRLGLHVFRNFAVGVVDQLGLLRIVVQNGPIIYKVYQSPPLTSSSSISLAPRPHLAPSSRA